MKTLAIIGGGAAGLSAAVAAGEKAARVGEAARVVVFEASDRVGRSILATGNGRCNFSNASIDPSLYHNASFACDVLGGFESRFDSDHDNERCRYPNGVVRFFSEHGMLWRQEGEGRLYPQANKASVVLSVLRSAAITAGVEERVDTRIAQIEPPRESGKPFTLRTSEGVFERVDRVIVACGGSVARALLPEGEGMPAYFQPRPMLSPIATRSREVCELNNIRVKAALSLIRDGEVFRREVGEVLFRKYGISGIAAFNLSREACPGDIIEIDFLPAIDRARMHEFLADRGRSLVDVYGKHMTYGDFMRGMLLPLVSDVLLARCGVREEDVYSKAAHDRIASELKSFTLEVEGLAEPEHAQVHRGGFDPYAFDPSTMECYALPGLHMTGEALDVDGPCGGYNLHWAFATGLVAGWAAIS